MKVYVLLFSAAYEGSQLLGVYQYLSQAQEAGYAYRLENSDIDGEHSWTEIREVTMGAAPDFECGKVMEG